MNLLQINVFNRSKKRTIQSTIFLHVYKTDFWYLKVYIIIPGTKAIEIQGPTSEPTVLIPPVRIQERKIISQFRMTRGQ